MLNLAPYVSPGAGVIEIPDGWRLEIPAGPAGSYRVAQLDDYSGISRSEFPWQAPVTVSLTARASAPDLPGTWGFGLWNDPFSLSLGLGGGGRRFPALPNTAWFFFASPQNYLSLRDDLPAHGALAAVFSSPAAPAWMLGLAVPAAILLALRPVTRLFRRLARRVVRQDAAGLSLDACQRHTYRLEWQPGRTAFAIDGREVFACGLSPRGPLGLVMWIDNQYAALPPDGRLGYGALPSREPAWIEVTRLEVKRGFASPSASPAPVA